MLDAYTVQIFASYVHGTQQWRYSKYIKRQQKVKCKAKDVKIVVTVIDF